MSTNIIKTPAGVSVSASSTDVEVSKPFELKDPWRAQLKVVLSNVAETTALTFKLKDSYDNGASYYDVGSESQVTLTKKTAAGGTAEVSTITFPDKASAAMGDYVVITDKAGTDWAAALDKQMYEVQTLTFPDNATAAHQDYIVVEDTTGAKWAVALTKPVAEVQTLTFPAKASATDGDYIVVEDTTGTKWAVALDTTGAAAATPSGAIWTAIPANKKVYYDISGTTDAASVAAAAELAFNGLTGFTSVITTDDTAADGTMVVTQVVPGTATDPVPHNTGDTGAGSISVSVDTAGANGNFNTSNEQISITTHGFSTGDRVIFRAGTAAPGGLTDGSTYYVIRVDANTLKLATSQANALAGTAINLTSIGQDTQTLYKADYEIRLFKEDTSDVAQLPIWNPCVVVCNTGSGDSCTVSAIYVQ